MMENLFAEIEKSHIFKFTDDKAEIDAFEEHCGYKLPTDLKGFYYRYKTIKLFPRRGEWLYRFVPVSEIQITGPDIYGKYYENDGPNSWFTIYYLEKDFLGYEDALDK